MTAHNNLRLLFPLLLAAFSCNSGAKLAAAKFSGPSALAAFRGYSTKHPGETSPRPYLAVANRLRDEITMVDPLDGELVPSATLSFPLSVPTRPRPFRLAAAPLEADGDPARGADLLVVATQSPPSVQLVTTWTEELRALDLGPDDDLAAAYPGAAVLSLAAASRPGGGAWVFVGLSGGHLAVLEFERDPSSPLAASRRPVRRTVLPLQRKELLTGAGRFDPLDLAVAPDLSRLFVATTDPLQDGGGATVSGVGQLTVVGASAASAWPVVGLDARAPTRLVAAGSFVQRTVASSVVFESTPTLQVFAVLDEEGCGLRKPIPCGLVTLLPDVGIAPDPAGELSYRAPIQLSGTPSALALVMPRKGGDSGTPVGVSYATAPDPLPDLMTLPASSSDGTVVRFWQPALLVVGLADGRLVAVDPARWGVVNAKQRRDAARRLLVTAVAGGVSVSNSPRLGVWNDVARILDPSKAEALVTDNAAMHLEVRSTAGYLPDETFSIAWQGPLPRLSTRSGILQWDGGQPVAAIQVGGVAGAHVDDPELGVHVGDLVRIIPTEGACNPNGFVATVRGIRAASATFPGGALVLGHAGGTPVDPGDTACAGGADLVSDASPGPIVLGSVTVNASGLVLTGEVLGYLGRPTFDTDFELRYQAEAGLTGEALAIARKLRRRHYPADAPCGASIPGTETGAPPAPLTSECDSPLVTPPGADPMTPGPALKLRIGVEGGASVPGTGATLLIAASSGLTSAIWASTVASGIPTAITWLDASAIDGSRTSTVYASFATNEVLGVVPSTGVSTSIR